MSEPVNPDDREQAATGIRWLRALLLGGLGALLIAVGIAYNDEFLKQSSLAGHQFPLVPMGSLLLIALCWNPLWLRLWPALSLRRGELVVFLAMTLPACWVAGASFMRHFFKQIVLPWYYAPSKLAWQEYGLLEHLPTWMSPAGRHPEAAGYDQVYAAFAGGLSPGESVPLAAWWPVLLAWAPLIAVFAIGAIALSMVVHRQWARHEQLAYPLAQVATTMLDRQPGQRLPTVFLTKAFKIGIGLVLAVQMMRLLHAWFPDATPDLRLNKWMNFLWTMVPHANQAGLQMVQAFNFFFLIVGISYFVAAEISLTFGLAQIILCLLGIQIYVISGRPLNSGTDLNHMRAGAYLCYATMICFIGRHYYLQLLRRALGLVRSGDASTDIDGVWAARVLLLCGLIAYGLLIGPVGIDPLVAILWLLLATCIVLVFSRIICETGIPYMQTIWSPGIMLGQLTGPAFLGPGAMVLTYYLSTIALPDTACSLAPYAGNALKIADSQRLRPLLIAGAALLGIVIAIGGSCAGRLHALYTNGAVGPGNHRYSSENVPQGCFDRAAFDHITLAEQGLLQRDDDGRLSHDAAGRVQPLRDGPSYQRLDLIQVDGRTLTFFLAGAAGVLLFFVCRLRFTWFPLHPILFLVWGTYPMWLTAWAWLIGWAAKKTIISFGGGRAYQQWKPFFIGLIVGDLAASLIGVIIGWIAYAITGTHPPGFSTLPT